MNTRLIELYKYILASAQEDRTPTREEIKDTFGYSNCNDLNQDLDTLQTFISILSPITEDSIKH